MRISLPRLRIPRRLASEVLESAQNKIAFTKLDKFTSDADRISEPRAFFSELPPQLQRFFRQFPPKPFREYASNPTATNAPDANPFLANKHPVTNAWHKPKFSMRRQADLWKAAYRFGIQHLLPNLLHNRKFYEEKYAEGVKMRGAHQFKLSRGERIAPARALEVAEATAKLDDKIKERKGRRFAKFLENKKKVTYV